MSGSETVNLDPLPILDLTEMSPPIAYARLLLTIRPSPTPSVLSSLFLIILLKGVNRLVSFLRSIPTPESFTMTLIDCKSILTTTVTYPFDVYLTALDTKLMSIYLSLFPSK